jgi:hypothetical protein
VTWYSKLKNSSYLASQKAAFPQITIETILLALLAIIKPLRPQSKHTRNAHLQFIVLDEHLRSSLTLLSANLAFHEGYLYRSHGANVKRV